MAAEPDHSKSRLRRISGTASEFFKQLKGSGTAKRRFHSLKSARSKVEQVAAESDTCRNISSSLIAPSGQNKRCEFDGAHAAYLRDSSHDSDEDNSHGVWKLTNKERHLVTIKYALLLEQERHFKALPTADLLEIQEAEDIRRRQQDAEKILREQADKFNEHLKCVGFYYTESSESSESSCSCNRNDWRLHSSLRLSNRMNGGYRDDCYYDKEKFIIY